MEHKSISIADQIFENLERDILSGKYPRGDLLTETRLSEELQVSRTPVREAMSRLAQENLIQLTSRGALVIGISSDEINMIYELRSRIEGLAASRAARNADPEDIDELGKIVSLQEFYTERGEAENIKDTDNAFHRKIYETSGSIILCNILCDLHKKVLKYRKASVSNRSRAAESLAEHRAIYAAIAAHDEAEADRTVTLHTNHAKERLLAQLKNDEAAE